MLKKENAESSMALHTEGTKRKPFITKNMSTPKYPDSNNPKWNSTTAMIAMPFKESISCLYSIFS